MAISNSNDRFNGYVASLSFKAPVMRATNTNQVLSGDPGAIDGHTWSDGDRILLFGQTDQIENGIWLVNITSAWERAPDFDGNRDVAPNTLVVAGTNAEAVTYRVSSPTDGVIVVGTTALSFSPYFGGGTTGPEFGAGGAAADQVTFWETNIALSGDPDFTVTFQPNVLTFNGREVVQTIDVLGAGGVNIEGSGPIIWLDDNDAGVNLTTWTVRNLDGQFIIAAATDDRISQNSALVITRTGTDPTEALFNGMRARITGGSLFIQSQEAAYPDISGHGQYWSDVPYAMYTDQNGIDQILDPSLSDVVGVNSNFTAGLIHKGKTISFSGSTASQQLTIPANSAVAYELGTFLGFDNSGSVDVSIGINTDTLVWADDGTTGTRTLAPGGYAVAQKVGTTTWKIAGKQLS
jgi:hypothetical protein